LCFKPLRINYVFQNYQTEFLRMAYKIFFHKTSVTYVYVYTYIPTAERSKPVLKSYSTRVLLALMTIYSVWLLKQTISVGQQI